MTERKKNQEMKEKIERNKIKTKSQIEARKRKTRMA